MVVTGTGRAREAHSKLGVAVASTVAVGVPGVLTIAGLARLGWQGIMWGRAALAGALGALVVLIVGYCARKLDVTRLDLADLAGSTVAAPRTRTAWLLGAFCQLCIGALLAIAWAFGLGLADLPANWLTATVWVVTTWALELMMLSSLGAIHPLIRRGRMPDPGALATNCGGYTPLVTLASHLAYGAVLASVYPAL